MAERTRQELEDLATNVNIIDNNTEQIDPSEVRDQYAQERDSTINKLDDGVEALEVVSGKYLKYSTPPDVSSMDVHGLATKGNINEISSDAISSHVAQSDPHTQYLDNTKGDVRYYQKSEIDTQQGFQDANIGNNSTNISNLEAYQIVQDNAISLNTAKVSADGSVNTHSDVDLTGLTVFQNSILKYDGINYVPCLNVLIDAPSLIINNTNIVVDVVNTNIDVQRLNPHKITISYGWSLNDPRQDFETFATFGGQDIAKGLTDNNAIHIQEPKDVAGADPDGRGTNQKLPFTRVFIVTPTSLGNNNIILQMSGSQNGDLASIWDVKIEIEEYINVNNL